MIEEVWIPKWILWCSIILTTFLSSSRKISWDWVRVVMPSSSLRCNKNNTITSSNSSIRSRILSSQSNSIKVARICKTHLTCLSNRLAQKQSSSWCHKIDLANNKSRHLLLMKAITNSCKHGKTISVFCLKVKRSWIMRKPLLHPLSPSYKLWRKLWPTLCRVLPNS